MKGIIEAYSSWYTLFGDKDQAAWAGLQGDQDQLRDNKLSPMAKVS